MNGGGFSCTFPAYRPSVFAEKRQPTIQPRSHSMETESVARFATASRIHIALPVKNLDQSIAFYQRLFGQDPSKVRERYAKFEVAEPPVNLSLNEVSGSTAPVHAVSHFGIQVKSTAAVKAVAARLTEADIALEWEDHVSCCYAVQNKVWAQDPDGNKWETYVLLDDNATQHHSSGGSCCPDIAPLVEAVQLGDIGTAQRAVAAGHGMAGCCSPKQLTAT